MRGCNLPKGRVIKKFVEVLLVLCHGFNPFFSVEIDKFFHPWGLTELHTSMNLCI